MLSLELRNLSAPKMLINKRMECWGGYSNILGSVHFVRFKKVDRGLQLPQCVREECFSIAGGDNLQIILVNNFYKDRNT